METMTSEEIGVWNRAALNGGGLEPGIGDKSLGAMLLAHSLVMNGGVRHAVECLEQGELMSAISGYRFFGLHQVVALFEQAIQVPMATGETPNDADLAYSGIVPNDGVLREAFARHFRSSREQFSRIT